MRVQNKRTHPAKQWKLSAGLHTFICGNGVKYENYQSDDGKQHDV